MGDSASEGSDTDEEDEEAAPKRRQIFFCSRTHSQLSQFVSELHRTPFAETLSVVAIAGRKVSNSLVAAWNNILETRHLTQTAQKFQPSRIRHSYFGYTRISRAGQADNV